LLAESPKIMPCAKCVLIKKRSITCESQDVEELLEKIVSKDGKVGGLTKHAGKNVLIVVTKKENKK